MASALKLTSPTRNRKGLLCSPLGPHQKNRPGAHTGAGGAAGVCSRNHLCLTAVAKGWGGWRGGEDGQPGRACPPQSSNRGGKCSGYSQKGLGAKRINQGREAHRAAPLILSRLQRVCEPAAAEGSWRRNRETFFFPGHLCQLALQATSSYSSPFPPPCKGPTHLK